MEVDIELIKPSPYQPRLRFDVEDLKQEIQKDGLLSPLLVRKIDGYYELIDGERRLRALEEMGWNKVPVEVRELDDGRARLSVYKLNMVREAYSVEERARYFKRLYDAGMTFYRIGKELSLDDNWVLAHINIFRFPEDIQETVWTGALSVSHIQTLEPIIGATIEEATKVARMVIERRLSERELRSSISDKVQVVKEARIKAAKEAIKGIGVATPISVNLEEPQELEKAARALLEEAKKKRDEALTPEEKEELEREREQKKKRVEKARQALEEKVRSKVEPEVERRAREIVEAERKRIEAEAKIKAREEVLKDPNFFKELRESVTNPSLLVESGGAKRLVGADEAFKPSAASIITEVNTGYIFKCPVCEGRYQIYHLKPTDSHTFRGVEEE